MGRDKAQLPYSGGRLVDQMARVLRDAGAARVLVSGEVDGHECIPDQVKGLGPLGGLVSTCEALLAEGCVEPTLLVVPVDMPLMTAELLRALGGSLKSSAAARFTGFELPFAIACTAKTVAEIRRLLTPGIQPRDRSIRALLRAVGSLEVPLPQSELSKFVNLNTPEEWERAAKSAG